MAKKKDETLKKQQNFLWALFKSFWGFIKELVGKGVEDHDAELAKEEEKPE